MVAIFNSNDDVVEMLRYALELVGMVVVSGHIDAVRRGKANLSAFVESHNPDVVIYDVVPPYDRRHSRETVDLTGTNAARVTEIVGAGADVHEITEEPCDIESIVKAVQEAAAMREASSDRRRT